MRITLLLTAGLERPVGARYLPLCVEMARRGHQVRVLALHPDFAACRQRRYVDRGVQVWYVGQMHARKSGSVPGRLGPFALLLTVLRSTLAMTAAALASPSDLYHLGKPQPINGLAGLIASRLRGVPLYVDCDDDERHSGRFTARWQRALFGWFEDHLPPLAAGVTVNTCFLYERRRAGGIPAARLAYVPNGADLQHTLAPAPILDGLRRALGLQGRRVIAYAGTLALHNHPVDLLLDAFARLAGERPDLTLLFIGGGEDLPLLRRRAETLGVSNCVIFTGHLPRASVRHYLALADVSVDPVDDDIVARARSPLKIMESLALGVPVVTASVGDRPRLLADGAGFLTTPGDPIALAETLGATLDDPAALRQAAIAARTTAQRYAWGKLVDEWLRLYETGG
jgi:glycosyltransferase involved in cell wall biosynthesis